MILDRASLAHKRSNISGNISADRILAFTVHRSPFTVHRFGVRRLAGV